MVVSLSLHKNKIESRRKRDLSNRLKTQVGKLVKEQDIRAYAIVGIGSNGDAFAYWDTGAILPQWAFADTVATILRKDVQETNVKDDWKPTLPVFGA